MNNKTIDYKKSIPEIKLPEQMNDFPCVEVIKNQLTAINKIIAEFNKTEDAKTFKKITTNEVLKGLLSKYLTGKYSLLTLNYSAMFNMIKIVEGDSKGVPERTVKELRLEERTPAFRVADGKTLITKDGDSFGSSSEKFKKRYGEALFAVYSGFIKALNEVNAHEQ